MDKGMESSESYSTVLRRTNPEKMRALEDMVRMFESKVKISADPALNDKSVAMIANSVANKLRRTLERGATDEEIRGAIEETLFEGVDARQKIQGEHLDTKSGNI